MDGYYTDASLSVIPDHFIKNGKMPMQRYAKDGTLLVVNNTGTSGINEHQMKVIENQHTQQMGKQKTADRLRAKLAERQAAKATAKK